MWRSGFTLNELHMFGEYIEGISETFDDAKLQRRLQQSNAFPFYGHEDLSEVDDYDSSKIVMHGQWGGGVAQKSIQDLHANMAGYLFYQRLLHTLRRGGKFKFDICDYVSVGGGGTGGLLLKRGEWVWGYETHKPWTKDVIETFQNAPPKPDDPDLWAPHQRGGP